MECLHSRYYLDIVFYRIIRVLIAILLVLLMVVIVVINVNLYYEPEIAVRGNDTIQIELLQELRGLGNALDQNADLKMQSIYPEGYVFLNAVYALAWSEFLRNEQHKEYLKEGQAEMQKAWNKIDSQAGRAPFSENLTLPYGSFYNGWSAYVLASKLRLESASTRNSREVDHLKQQCDRISEAIERNTYPPSYHGAAWPADVIICVASLALHDQLFEPKYKALLDTWLTEVKKRLDVNGMIPHSVDAGNGQPEQEARGSSMALMLMFLHEIDQSFAKEQFRHFKENFVDSKFGLVGIREYPKGESGAEDIDSGPVIMGFGGAATIVGMKTLSLFGAHDLSIRIRSTVEAMAFPSHTESQKRYFFHAVPMADAFIAWSHSGMPTMRHDISFGVFHIYSFIGFTIVAVLFWILTSGGALLRTRNSE